MLLWWSLAAVGLAAEPDLANARKPGTPAELQYWLGNMVWHHRYSTDEIRDATGLSAEAIGAALERFNITPQTFRPGRQTRLCACCLTQVAGIRASDSSKAPCDPNAKPK